MRRLQFLALALCLLALSVSMASAQKRPTHKTTGSTTTTTVPPLQVRAARDKVDVQLSNVNAWLDKFGPIALNLDSVIADEKAGKLSGPTSAKIDAAKDNVVT